MIKKIWKIIKLILVLPILPLFFWGPFTHPVINKLAHEKAQKQYKKGDKRINPLILETIDKYPEVFYFAGNGPDAIAINNILTNISVYDYTHNYHPDNVRGSPVFGYRLIDSWIESGRFPPRDLAVACGWLAHQVADWLAHYAAFDNKGRLLDNPYQDTDNITTFSGYSNSFRVFGTEYNKEILKKYTITDHALIEFFHDIIMYSKYKNNLLKNTGVELFDDNGDSKGNNLLTYTSEFYRGNACRIPPDDISLMKEHFTFVIGGLNLLINLCLSIRPELPDLLYSVYKWGCIPKAVDKVFDDVFCLSAKTINNYSVSQLNEKDIISPIKIEKIQRSGTILFPIVHKLGSFVEPKKLIPYITGKPLRISLFWGLINLRLGFVSSLIKSLTVSNLKKLSHSENTGELLSYISGLLIDKEFNLKGPLKNFRTNLPPIIKLHGRDEYDKQILLTKMFQNKNIKFKVIPAIYYKDPKYLLLKEIDPESLTFRVNGYDVAKNPDDFLLTIESKEDTFEIGCKMLGDIPPGQYHIYFNIKDKSGIQSNAFDYQLNVL